MYLYIYVPKAILCMYMSCIYMCMYIYIRPYSVLPSCSQLHMFLQLMQQAPDVLQALGMSPDALKQEIIMMEKTDKLKVYIVLFERSCIYQL